jgi:predicted small secreted protein
MKTSAKRLVLLLLTSALWTVFSTSCNTVRGVGRDVESAGEGIQKSTR